MLFISNNTDKLPCMNICYNYIYIKTILDYIYKYIFIYILNIKFHYIYIYILYLFIYICIYYMQPSNFMKTHFQSGRKVSKNTTNEAKKRPANTFFQHWRWIAKLCAISRQYRPCGRALFSLAVWEANTSRHNGASSPWNPSVHYYPAISEGFEGGHQ